MSFNYEIRNGTIVTPDRSRPRKDSTDDSWLAPADYDDLLETNSTGSGSDVDEGDENASCGLTRKLTIDDIKRNQRRRRRTRSRSNDDDENQLFSLPPTVDDSYETKPVGGLQGAVAPIGKGLSQYKWKCLQQQKERDSFQRQASQSIAKFGYFV